MHGELRLLLQPATAHRQPASQTIKVKTHDFFQPCILRAIEVVELQVLLITEDSTDITVRLAFIEAVKNTLRQVWRTWKLQSINELCQGKLRILVQTLGTDEMKLLDRKVVCPLLDL